MTMTPDQEKSSTTPSSNDKPAAAEGDTAATTEPESPAEAASEQQPAAATPAEDNDAASEEAKPAGEAEAKPAGALPDEQGLKPLWVTYGVIIALFVGIWIANWFGLVLPVRQDPPEEQGDEIRLERVPPASNDGAANDGGPDFDFGGEGDNGRGDGE